MIEMFYPIFVNFTGKVAMLDEKHIIELEILCLTCALVFVSLDCFNLTILLDVAIFCFTCYTLLCSALTR